MRFVIAASLALAAAVISPPSADACSCVARAATDHFHQADAVYVAVAGPKKKAGKAGWTQRFRVFETLKGAPRRQFVWTRLGPSPCDPEYKTGEAAVLFASKGDLFLCSGNIGIDALRGDLTALLRAAASPARRTRPTLRALARAVTAATRGYRHGRVRIGVRVGDPALTGSRRVGPTLLEMTQREDNKQIVIDDIAAAGRVTAVFGHYDVEGLRFVALVSEVRGHRTLKSGKHVPLAPRVLKVWQIER